MENIRGQLKDNYILFLQLTNLVSKMKALNLFIFMLILTGFFFSAEAKVSTDLKLYFVDIYNKPLVKMEVSVRSLSSDDLIKNITTNERGLITLTQSEMPDNEQFYFV